MALRWSLTQNAYNRFAYMFEKEPPVIIECKSPISTAANIRDVIKYAFTNGLKGKEWHGNVVVSPHSENAVMIYPKENSTAVVPSHSIFELVMLLEGQQIVSGYRCNVTDGWAALAEILDNFPKYHVVNTTGNIAKFTLVGEE